MIGSQNIFGQSQTHIKNGKNWTKSKKLKGILLHFLDFLWREAKVNFVSINWDLIFNSFFKPQI